MIRAYFIFAHGPKWKADVPAIPLVGERCSVVVNEEGRTFTKAFDVMFREFVFSNGQLVQVNIFGAPAEVAPTTEESVYYRGV